MDLSRYTEKPIPKIKELFKYWLDKAAWHQPSTLVFDNIDKLMGVEVEVSPIYYKSAKILNPVHFEACRLVQDKTYHGDIPSNVLRFGKNFCGEHERDYFDGNCPISGYDTPSAQNFARLR